MAEFNYDSQKGFFQHVVLEDDGRVKMVNEEGTGEYKPGSQYRFFQNIKLDENGQIIVDIQTII